MPGPEGSSGAPAESVRSPQEIFKNTVTSISVAAAQLNQAGISGEQQGQLVNTVLGGVIELHQQGHIGRNETLRDFLQAKVFTADLAHKVLAEGLVSRIETMASDRNPQARQAVPSLLELSTLLGIDQTKYPDLTPRLRAVAAGGGEGGGRPPEGPQVPEPTSGPEWESSPERGRAIVKEIARMETIVPYEERYSIKTGLLSAMENPKIYNERNGCYLDQLYADLKDYTGVLREGRNKRDSWNPISGYREIKRRLEAAARGEKIEETTQQLTVRKRDRGELPANFPQESTQALYAKYSTAEDLDVVVPSLAIYFQAARALGLLDGADNIFDATLKQLADKGLSVETKYELLERNTQFAKKAIGGAFRAAGRDPRFIAHRSNLVGIGEAYAQRTQDLFHRYLNGDSVEPENGEFHFGQEPSEEEDLDNYWRPGHYPKMYEITGTNVKQLSRAIRSFLSKVTTGELGKSAGELYEHFTNFTEKFRQVASSLGMPGEFVKKSAQLLMGRGFIFGADYSFESYNMRSANQFLMGMALDEGPQRFVEVARSGRGGVGAYLYKFDFDPRVTFMHNPGGSRGQLLSDTITQHYLHSEIKNILIEEGMGVVIKDYHPDIDGEHELKVEDIIELPDRFVKIQNKLNSGTNVDALTPEEKEFYDQFLPKLEEAQEVVALFEPFIKIHNKLKNGTRFDELAPDDQKDYLAVLPAFRNDDMQQANINRIGIHQKHEQYKGLYAGFDDGGAHIANFQRFGKANQAELPADLRRSVVIGKVQIAIENHTGRTKDQLLKIIGDEKKGLVAAGQLTMMDRHLWEEAYDQSKSNFDAAFQMVGATGEKARRGGGVFYVDRKDEQGKKFVDNIPVYLAEKWVQYFVTSKIIEYSKSGDSAVSRTAAVEEAQVLAIQQLKEKGFAAKISIPKLKFDTNPNSASYRDVIGIDGTEIIDFDTAVNSPKSQWINDTYFSYQPETRQTVTEPRVVAAAKRRRMALSMSEEERVKANLPDPENEDFLASFLLLIDPTLKRVKRIEDSDVEYGQSAQQQEIIIFDAAIEASNQRHWRITRKLNAIFMSPDGDAFKMRTGYNLEDYSGIARFIIRMRQFVASNPKRFARRYAAEIVNLPLNVSSMPDQWGQPGVLGAIEMFADPIGDMADQKLASQFAITKWVEQMRIGSMIYEALVGHVDSERGFSVEGLFEKPTNNAERITKIQKNIEAIKNNSKGVSIDYVAENEFMELVLESFDRLGIVLKLVRTMESDTRNAQGALDLEKEEVFINGKVNPEIIKGKVGRDTGSSRHTEKQFFDAYIKWLTKGQGVEAYPGEATWYKLLLQTSPLDPNGKITRAEWIFNKMVR